MDEYMHHRELLLNQARPMEAYFSLETALITSPQKQSTSPDIMPMEPLLLDSLEELSDHVGKVNCCRTSQYPSDFLAADSQLAFVPKSSLSSTSHGNNPVAKSTTTAQVKIGSMNSSMMSRQSLPQFPQTSLPRMPNENFYQLVYGCPPPQVPDENLAYVVDGCPLKQHPQEQNNLYHVIDGFPPTKQPSRLNYHLMDGYPQNPQQQQVLLMGNTNLQNQVPCMNEQVFFSSNVPNPRYLNPTGNPMGSNWEGVKAYLLGKVRPSPGIAYIFTCSICGVEFPNAQALGGHMSSHKKIKKSKNMAATKHHFKRAASKSSYSTNIREATVWPLSLKSTSLNKVGNEKNNMKEKEMFLV